MAFYPYLYFGGNCREAFTRYHEIFGGEVNILGLEEMPAEERAGMPEGMEDRVMHAALMFPDGALLMASDAEPGDFGPVQGMYVNYSTADIDEARKVWDGLSEGGEVEQEPVETFWSPYFGVCKDRFGTPWMINAEGEHEPN